MFFNGSGAADAQFYLPHTHTEDTLAHTELALFFAYVKTEMIEIPLQALDTL